MSTLDAKHYQYILYQFCLAIFVGILLGISISITTPIVVIASLTTIFLFFLLLKKPEYGLLGYLILTSSFFDSTANVGFSLPFGHVYLTDFMLFTFLSMILIRSLVEPGFNIVHTPLDLPLLLFVGIAFFSTFIAIRFNSLNLLQSLGEMRIVASYLLFFAVTNLIRNDNQLRFLIRWMIILGSLVSIAMIVQYIVGPTNIRILAGRLEVLSTEGTTSIGVTRIIPPGDSIVLVGFIVLCVILWFEESNPQNLVLFIPTLLIGLGVLFTFKRHYWVAAIIVLILIVLIRGRRKPQNLIISGLVAIFLLSIGFFYIINFTGEIGPRLISASSTRLISLTDQNTYTDPSSSLRWRDFEDQYALPQIAAHPLIGLGLGARYRPLVPPKDWAEFDGRAFIHNAHLWLLVKTGILGYLPLFLLFVISLYRGFKYWRKVPETRNGLYVLGLTLALFAMLFGSWVEPTLMEAPWAPVIGIILGMSELILTKTNLNRPGFMVQNAVVPGLPDIKQ